MRSLRLAVGAVLVVAVLAGSSRPARAEAGPFGLGIILGSPTGISAKYYLGGTSHAIDAAFGGAFGGYGGFHVHADYLWHPVILTRNAGFFLPLHIGIGARLLDHNRGRDYKDDDDDHIHLGARVPVGITFDFRQVPLDAFFELAVIVDFIEGDRRHEDNVGIDLNAGIGIRYYF